MVTEARYSLPPRLEGAARSNFTVTLANLRLIKNQSKNYSNRSTTTGPSPFIYLSFLQGQNPSRYDLTWWGHPKPQSIPISGRSKVKVSYDVVTAEGHFKDYLRDAGKLFVEVIDEVSSMSQNYFLTKMTRFCF